MAKIKNRTGSPLWALILLCMLCLSGTGLLGQDDKPKLPPWVHLTIFDVNPSMVDDFLAVQQEYKALAKKAETPWRAVMRTEVFGHVNRFMVMTPLENLASFDRPGRGSAEQSSLENRLERCISNQQSWAVYLVPQMSKPLAPDEEPSLMVVNLARIYPGREQDYSELMKSDFLPHFDENDVNYLTGSLAFGGVTGFIHFFYVDNFAALDEGSPVMRELGAEGAQQVMSRFSGIVSSSELWIARYLPDLSLKPKTEKEKKAEHLQ